MLSFLKRGSSIDKIVRDFVLAMLIAMVASVVLAYVVDSSQHLIAHTLLEGVNLFVLASTFVIVWLTYENITPVEKFLGYSFLGSTIFQSFHIYYYLRSAGQVGPVLYQAYLCSLLSRLVVAIAIYVLSRRSKTDMNSTKKVGLVLTIIYSFLLLAIVRFAGNSIGQLGLPYQLIEISSIVVLLSTAFLSLRHFGQLQVDKNTYMSQRFLILAILIAIPTDLILYRYEIVQTSLFVFGHLLKVILHSFLFRGIFVGAVINPYKRLEKSKQNLEANRQYMQDLLNSLPVALWTYNQHNRLSFANKRAEEMLGISFNDLAGLTNDEVSSTFYRNVPKQTIYKKLHKTNKPITNSIIDVETKQGQRMKLKIDMLKLNNGSTMVIFNEAKKEQELDRLQLQTQAILNAVHNMVVIVDEDRRFLACNKAFEEITELDSKAVLGRNIEEVIYHDLQVSIRDEIEKSVETEKLYETQIVTPSGVKKQLHYHAAPIKNVDEEFMGYVIVASDVTKLKHQERALQHHEKLALLGQMAAGIVHEIRNPLTVIKGYGQLIEMMIEDPRAKKYAQEIDIQAEQMNRVVTDFLKFAKPGEPEMVTSTINEVITSIKLMLESHSFMKGADITFVLTEDDYRIKLDPDQIKQVILNMVQNAVEASAEQPKSEVKISSRYNAEEEVMVLEISDNGRGISEEELKHIGTPFYTTKGEGTGLGMSICYQIVNEHGGQIRFESQEGVGTKAIISLPIEPGQQDEEIDVSSVKAAMN